ncbi:MAG TPA: type II secretion system minor pseudopilin GspH [Gammaproteobacteria bacterium]|nr:type II secretion system minor pseudopilin GspH [Gammaproteobacteria bacterium]
MPTRARGFTLIEILVVMVIVAIIAGVAVLSLGSLGRAPPAKHAAEQLSALAELAAQQAVMEGQQYGLLINRHGYAFFVYDGNKWLPIRDDTTFRARNLGDDVTLDLHLEGTPVNLASNEPVPSDNTTASADAADQEDADGAGGALQPKPQIALLSSGEITPFEITISDSVDPAAQYRVRGSLLHGIELKSPGDKNAD